MAWEIVKWGGKGGVAILLLLVAACGEVGGSGQCGGAESTATCLRIESIVPGEGDNGSNVDAFRGTCNAFEVAQDATVEPEAELFTDHNAKITISNKRLPGVPNEEPLSDITLSSYAITYSLNRCPSGATCPTTLSSLTANQQISIPADDTVETSLPFVPLSTKFEYDELGGSELEFPSYTATYTIIGTDSFGNDISVQGSAEFTIGNFDNCSGT